MKKQYTKPSMMVYELNSQPELLAGSAPEYPDRFGFVPGTGDDMNKLA